MKNQLTHYLKAGYSHFYVKSDEPILAIEYIRKQLKEWKEELPIKVWGFSQNNPDPLEPIMVNQNKEFPQAVILKNYNWFLFEDSITKSANKELVQYIQDTLQLYKTTENRVIICIVSSASIEEGLPSELIRDFIEVNHPLPTRKEIEEIMEETIKTAKMVIKEFPVPNKKEKNHLIDSAIGMRWDEVQNSMFLSVVKNAKLKVEEVIDRRTAYLESIAGIKYIQYEETFDSLKGYDVAKYFVKSTIIDPEAKGICLLGPSGTGKSHFSKACSGEFGIPMLTVEMAELQGGIVGQTEENVRKIIEVINSFIQVENGKATGRLIVFIDELEKGFAGSGGAQGYSSDSMNQRANSQLLKFMQDRPDGIYFLATCNSIDLPPEYLRAERWDTAPFFIDLPQEEERQAILDYYADVYKVPGKELSGLNMKSVEGWAGSELKTACRLFSIFQRQNLGISLQKIVESFIVPISVTKKEEINALRTWSEGRTLQASKVIVDKSKGYSTRKKRQLEL